MPGGDGGVNGVGAARTAATLARRFAQVSGALVLLATVAGGCSGGSKGSTATNASDTTAASPSSSTPGDSADSSTTLPAGAVAGLDDYDGDGQPDPTCGTQDFGAGLVLRIPCSITSAHEPASGTTLVKDSLFRLPGNDPADAEGISGHFLDARDQAGAKVVIIVFNTDALFETGSATIGSTDSLDASIRVINRDFAGGAIQVRGHTDATGSAAANQTLSVKRAENVRDYLKAHAISATDVSSVGLGSTQPLTLERQADGSDNAEGRRFNRRVELVVRLKG